MSHLSPPPLLPLRPAQRAAWLGGVRTLVCRKAFGDAFLAGESYAIATGRIATAATATRDSVLGEEEIVSIHGRELRITVYERGTGATGMGRAHHFHDAEGRGTGDEGREYPLADLAAHFDLPHVPDIAEVFPEQYARALAWLADFERRANAILPADSPLRDANGVFALKPFQREDLARASCIPKFSIQNSAFKIHAIRCVNRPSLATLIADCFDYAGCDEGVRLKADDSLTSLGVRRLNAARRLVLTGTPVKNQLHDLFWLLEWASHGGGVLGWEQGLGKSLALLLFGLLTGCRRHLLVTPESLHLDIIKKAAAFGITIRTLDSQAAFAKDPLLQQWQRDHAAGRESEAEGFWITSYTQLALNGADETNDPDERGNPQLSSTILRERRAWPGWRPVAEVGIGETIAYRIAQNFECGILNAESPAACGGIQNPKSNIQNSPPRRFPYPATPAGRAQFAADFMPVEENHSKAVEFQERTGRVKVFRRRIPGITNRHALWRILAGLVIRRTADELGTLVPIKTVPITVRPGKAQLAVYRHCILHPPTLSAKGLPIHPARRVLAQITALRTAATCPHSPKLRDMRSWTDACPKQSAALSLIARLIAEGERVVVLSEFQEFNAALHRRLTEAGVASVLLDGTVQASARGEMAERFKAGEFAALLGGKKAMGEGHSFECSAHIILPDDGWALDINLQAPFRVRRINSKRPVTVWRILTENTIDLRLAANREEKTITAGTALDSDFTAAAPEHGMSPGDLLREAVAGFDENAATTDEQLIEDEWERSLRGKLRGAMAKFREHHPAIVPLGLNSELRILNAECADSKCGHAIQNPTSSIQNSGANVSTKDVRTAMTVLRKSRLVDSIPDGTLRFLGRLPTGADTTALRTEFEQFMVNSRERQWTVAWPKFEAGRRPSKKKSIPSIPSAQNRDTPIKEDLRHLGI